MTTADRGKRGKPSYREMTVAHIREQEGRPYVEVVFLESARFYRLNVKCRDYAEILGRLRAALAEGRAVKVRCASPDSDLIEDVQAPGSGASKP